MIKLIYILAFGMVVSSCNDYSNKERYEIAVGESVDIYYSTNSCCYGCISNDEDLRHIQLIDDKTIDNGPDDCAGCNYVAAFTFLGQSVGVDTVKIKIVTASTDCLSSEAEASKFIIEVKD